MSVATDRQPLTAEDLREQLHAETRLAKLDLFEDLANLHDTEVLPSLRERFAARYRRAVGVDPELRQEFREALLRILDGGGQSVENVIWLLERRFR